MCAYPWYDNALTHCKCVLRYCADCPCINLPYQDTDNQYSDTTPSIRFNIYHIITRCTAHGRIPLKDKKICHMCKQEYSVDGYTKYINQKGNSYDRDNNLLFSYQFLYTRNPKVGLLPTTCAHT